MEVAALLGLAEGAGNVALMGDLAGHATELAVLVPGVEFIGIAEGLRGWEEGEGVSRMTARGRLPFGSGSLRGIGFDAVGGPGVAGEPPLAAELARVIAPTGRIAVWGSVGGWEDAFRVVGLEVLAQEESVLVVAPTDR
jgi:hypothetical protein